MEMLVYVCVLCLSFIASQPGFSFLVVGVRHQKKPSKRRRKKEGSDLVNYSLAMVFLMARPQSGKDMNMLLLTYYTT